MIFKVSPGVVFLRSWRWAPQITHGA